MTLQNISGKNNANYNNNDNSLLQILKNRMSNLEKDAIINFLLKKKSETNYNTSSINKTVAKNDEILESKRGNSSSSSNSKQKRETQAEPSGKKKKSY